jgi:hypothetical protein
MSTAANETILPKKKLIRKQNTHWVLRAEVNEFLVFSIWGWISRHGYRENEKTLDTLKRVVKGQSMSDEETTESA